MQVKRLKSNPITILGVWTVTMIVLTPILMVLFENGASGGEQKAFTTLATMIVVTIIGAAAISILTPFLFREWFKKNLIVAIIVILATAIPSISFLWLRYFQNPYSFIEKTRQINGNTIDIKEEYYDLEEKQLRSVSFYKNGNKDSVWTTYDKSGKIIEQKTYKGDILVHE
jgi:hypothetical protein